VAEQELSQTQGRQTGTQTASGGEPRVIQLRNSVCGDARSVAIVGATANRSYTDMFKNYLLHGDRAMGVQAALQKTAMSAEVIFPLRCSL
jgi:hypothetical protein